MLQDFHFPARLTSHRQNSYLDTSTLLFTCQPRETRLQQTHSHRTAPPPKAHLSRPNSNQTHPLKRPISTPTLRSEILHTGKLPFSSFPYISVNKPHRHGPFNFVPCFSCTVSLLAAKEQASLWRVCSRRIFYLPTNITARFKISIHDTLSSLLALDCKAKVHWKILHCLTATA